MSKIFLNYRSKKIFKLSIKTPKKSARGDFDIMIDAGSRMVFDFAIAGAFFQSFKNEVNAISWHGYYEKRESSELLNPVVHFKRKSGSKEELRHFGAINIEECIPFPVCSVYLPLDIDVSNMGVSKVSRSKNLVIDVDDHLPSQSVRYDFFVFPKGFHYSAFKESVAKIIFEGQSVDVFNNGGCLSCPERGLNAKYFELVDGDCVLIRSVSDPSDMYHRVSGGYSVIIHEPNDVYNLLNRAVIVERDDGNLNPPEIMRDLHEKSILIEGR